MQHLAPYVDDIGREARSRIATFIGVIRDGAGAKVVAERMVRADRYV